MNESKKLKLYIGLIFYFYINSFYLNIEKTQKLYKIMDFIKK